MKPDSIVWMRKLCYDIKSKKIRPETEERRNKNEDRQSDKKIQEETAAEYLGVSTPAINKWERGAANPDIALLGPLARLLGIDVDTLLSFREELNPIEIGRIGEEIVRLMEEQGFEAGLLMCGEGEKEKDYRGQIEKLYERAAQRLLDTLQENSYDKDTMQAVLYEKQGRKEEAAGLLEEKLLKEAVGLQMAAMSLLELACGEGEYERAGRYARIAGQTAELCGLSPYAQKCRGFCSLWRRRIRRAACPRWRT